VGDPLSVDDAVVEDEPVISLVDAEAVPSPEVSMAADVPSTTGEKPHARRRQGSECLYNFAPGATMPQVQRKRPCTGQPSCAALP